MAHDRLRMTMAEIVDKEFLRHIEPEHVYITTDKGHLFLKKGVTEVYESMPNGRKGCESNLTQF
jgi:predicted transcriptional regulator